MDRACDQEFLEKNMPLSLDFERDLLWQECENEKLRDLVKKYYYEYLKQKVGL